MVTASGFDASATTYDTSFTNTEIGRLQRRRVYKYLNRYLNTSEPLNILELNCGTGEDALFMAHKGHKVLATDVSSGMLSVAQTKSNNHPNLQFQQLNINDLEQLEVPNKPNLIFSNFGGLNCISPQQFQKFFATASEKVIKGGHIIGVIMPKRCLWERFYYLLKGAPKKAFRRNTDAAIKVKVEEKEITTWYYDPGEVKTFAAHLFLKELIKPIGFLIPPSYLNSYFRNKKGVLKFLAWLDNKLFSIGFLGAYADHYIIVLQKK